MLTRNTISSYFRSAFLASLIREKATADGISELVPEDMRLILVNRSKRTGPCSLFVVFLFFTTFCKREFDLGRDDETTAVNHFWHAGVRLNPWVFRLSRPREES